MEGMHDSAGGGVVHMLAGLSGLAGAYWLGERRGKEKMREFKEKHIDHQEIERICKESDLDAIHDDIKHILRE